MKKANKDKDNDAKSKKIITEQQNANIIKVRSEYIMKQIFSLLNEKKKLNILYYNKKIKKKCGININNYKKESGKYKIGGRNGNGKIYILDTNKLIFEGEFLNAKKHGKGKEYYEKVESLENEENKKLKGKKKEKKKKKKNNKDEDILKFEGEYKNGQRDGYGKL